MDLTESQVRRLIAAMNYTKGRSPAWDSEDEEILRRLYLLAYTLANCKEGLGEVQ